MNPKEACAFLSAKAGEGNSWPKPLGSGGRLREPAKERFPRDTYQHRRAYLNDSVQRSEQSRDRTRIVGTVRVNGEAPVEVDAIAETSDAVKKSER